MNHSLHAGMTDKRITFKRKGTTQDTWGQEDIGLSTLKRKWAKVKPISAKDVNDKSGYQAQHIEEGLTEFTTRYWVEGLDNSLIITYKGKDYSIISHVNVDDANKWIVYQGKYYVPNTIAEES